MYIWSFVTTLWVTVCECGDVGAVCMCVCSTTINTTWPKSNGTTNLDYAPISVKGGNLRKSFQKVKYEYSKWLQVSLASANLSILSLTHAHTPPKKRAPFIARRYISFIIFVADILIKFKKLTSKHTHRHTNNSMGVCVCECFFA